jgi:hypothetical protein
MALSDEEFKQIYGAEAERIGAGIEGMRKK